MLPSGVAGPTATGGCSLATCTTYLANRPTYDAWEDRIRLHAVCPFWHIKHGRTWVGLRLLPRVLAAIPVVPVAMVSWSSADRPR